MSDNQEIITFNIKQKEAVTKSSNKLFWAFLSFDWTCYFFCYGQFCVIFSQYTYFYSKSQFLGTLGSIWTYIIQTFYSNLKELHKKMIFFHFRSKKGGSGYTGLTPIFLANFFVDFFHFIDSRLKYRNYILNSQFH